MVLPTKIDPVLPKGIEDVVPADRITGEDAEDTRLLEQSLEKARQYLAGFAWCGGVRREYFGLGVGGVVAVFLFEINPRRGADEWLWVVVGDLPSAYLDIDEIKTPRDALDVYCVLMLDWAEKAEEGKDLSDAFPVGAPLTLGNAVALKRRVAKVRDMFELD